MSGFAPVTNRVLGVGGTLWTAEKVTEVYNSLDQRAINVKDPAFGAVGDGVTDDTAALDAALAEATSSKLPLYLPGTSAYYLRSTPWIVSGSGVKIYGSGRKNTIVRCNAAGVHCVQLGTASEALARSSIRDISFETGSAAGDVFHQVGGLHLCSFEGVDAVQRNPNQRVHYYNDTHEGLIDNLFLVFEYTMPTNAAVSGVWLYSTKGDINANLWESGRVNFSRGVNPFFRIENDVDQQYANDNVFRRITGEVTTGGLFGLYNVNSTHLDHCQAWDGDVPATNDMIYIARRTGGVGLSTNNQITNYGRRAMTLGAGIQDIKLGSVSGSVVRTRIEGAQNGTGSGLAIDCGSIGNSGVIYGPFVTTLTNANGFVVVGPSTLKTTTQTTANQPSAATSGVGAQSYDTTLGRPTWSDGSAWRGAALLQESNSFTKQLYPATPALAAQSACAIFAGTGAPNNANGANGDVYFRSDGGALTTIYQKRAGAWVGIV